MIEKEFVSKNSQPILADILWSEKAIGRRGNTFPLVVMATIFFETELKWCLCERVRPVAEDLILAIKQHKKSRFNLETLNAWKERKTGVTLAVIVMLLHGLRWAIRQDNREVKTYILDLFEDEFLDIGSKKAFALAVNEIREKYRNPALHGRKTHFSHKEYEKLARLIIGKKSFRDWCRSRENSPQADSGILHGHLSLAKNYPAPEMSG